MTIYRAMKTNWLTQGFGENLVPIYKEWGLDGHNGYDWFAPKGEGVYWDCDITGVVNGVEIDNLGGVGVDIITQSSEGNYLHRFWHLLPNIPVKAGDILESGDLIGYCDTTGAATGPHLHRGLKIVEKDQFGNWVTINKNNGYYGAIPIPNEWFLNKWIVDEVNDLKHKVALLSQLAEALKKLLGLQRKLTNIYD